MKTIKTKLLTMAVLLCSISASAYDFEVDGIYYNISSIEELTVSVTSGDNEYSGEIIIPEEVVLKGKTLKVTGIGISACSYCHGLTSITIPNSVTSIGDKAFRYCDNLKVLKLENGTEELSLGTNGDNGLFYDCPLETLYLGRNLLSNRIPFRGNETLRSVTIGNSVTSIERIAFSGCFGLKELKIEDGTEVLSLGNIGINGSPVEDMPFYDCPLETLHLGRMLSYYYSSSPFCSKRTLRSVTISDNVTSIGYALFRACSGLTSITIPNSVTIIGNEAFEDCI